MSEKKRQKKDGQNKDKLNQARRQDNSNKTEQRAHSPRQARDASNLSEVSEEQQRT
jgi:hypothetical protein